MNLDQMEVSENTSIESVKKSDTNSTLKESKNSDGPITPCLIKEKVKITSILRLNDCDDDPSTPIDDVLDQCASGPDGPDQINHSVTSVARKLDFEPNECVSENGSDNGSLMETVYESILEGIICKQAEDILAEMLGPGSSHSGHDVVMTPPSVARLTGLAETCPGAPLKPKPVRKVRVVDMSLCRKLDFDSY